MRPSSGRESCDCCKNASTMEFGKILEMKDVVIYRYLPQAQNENEKGTANGQVFILQKTGGDDVKLEEVIVESGKKKTSCPRCTKTIEHVKSLLKELPPANIREVTGICEHCYQKEFFYCPCCENVVDKFVKFQMEETKQTKEERERLKSWIIKTQLSLKKSFSNVKDGKLEPRTRPKAWIHGEADIEKELRVQMPLKKSVSDAKVSKLEPRRRLDGRVQEYEIPASRVRPEHVPAADLYEKQKAKGGSEKLQYQMKYRLGEEDIEEPLKEQITTKTYFSDMIDTRLGPRTRSEGRIQESEIPASRYIPTKKLVQEQAPFFDQTKYQQAEEIIEKPLRVLSFLDFPEEVIKPKPKKEKTGILKSREDGAPGDVSKPYEKMKRSVSPMKQRSFETVMKSLSEPNVSNFSYSFPHEKNVIKTQLRRQISSSEIIKNTQDMLQEREEAEKKKKAELKRLQEEKKMLAEEEKRKREEEKEKVLLKENLAKLEEGEEGEEGEERYKSTKRKKRYDIAATAALKEQLHKQAKELSEEEKFRKQNANDMALGEKKAREAKKTIEDKEKQLAAGEEGEEGEERYKSTKRKKRYDIAATAALKEQLHKQAKELSEEEKFRKQNANDMALGEKKAREAKKTIEDKEKQLAAENIRIPTIPDSEDGRKKDQGDKSEKLDMKYNGRDGKQHDVAATAALKDEVSKQAKEKSEEEKIRKRQEQDIALGEKKAKDAEKAIEEKQKQLTMEKVKKSPELKPDSKGDKRKGGKPEKTEKPAKEPKVKDDIHGEMAAMLKEQVAKQKQQELEKEKLRKEHQKEKELAEKRLKDLQTKKEEKAPVIKPLVILKPEVVSDEEEVSEVMLKPEEVADIIKGQKIYKVRIVKRAEEKHPILETKPVEEPQLKTDKEEPELLKQPAQQVKQTSGHKTAPGAVDTQHDPAAQDTNSKSASTNAKKLKPPDPEATKGVIRYTLSDRTFIDKGWTMLPTEKVVRKMNVYRMRPAKPEFDWFEHNKYKREMAYDSGEKLAEFDDNGRGRWYYRTGELALDYYDAEETNAGQRFVVYSTGQPDVRGRSRPRTILATFDYSGNGIVFDHTGKIRLKYNQTEGVVLDRTIGPVSLWKWHTLNDPPVLQQVMIDTQMPYKDPTILKMGDKNADQKRPDNEEMLAIEFENFLKEKRQKLTQSFKPFQIKMKAMKINENFSVRVLDQASVYLLFRDGTTNLKINLGMVLDHKEIVDTDTAEIGEVSNTLDKLPACTDSIAGLQKAVAQAQAQERLRVRHEQRLKRPEETASVDALRAGCSRPPRTPILQASLTSCDKMTPKRFKPSCSELYYSTQLC